MMGLVRRGLAAFAGGGGSSLVEDLALAGMRVAELLTRYVPRGGLCRCCGQHVPHFNLTILPYAAAWDPS